MLRILHITDSHLYADTKSTLKMVNTEQSFCSVLRAIEALSFDAELIVLGGDMAQDCNPRTYRRLKQHLAPWKTPCLLAPGNHENCEHAGKELLGSLIQFNHAQNGVIFGNWHIITLDSQQQGHVSGMLSEIELSRLRRLLDTTPAEHVALAVHHHPLPVGSAWIDRIALDNADALWLIIEQHPKVKLLLHGHTHQHIDSSYHGVRVLGTPSTCIQFKPKQKDFTIDNISPGFRWLELDVDGSIQTGVERIEGFIGDVNDVDEY